MGRAHEGCKGLCRLEEARERTLRLGVDMHVCTTHTHSRTGAGSLKDAPIMEGLKMAVGRSAASFRRTYSANPLVYVYVLGRLSRRVGLSRVSWSSVIHLG